MMPGFITDVFGFLFLLPLDPAVGAEDDRLLRRPADNRMGIPVAAGAWIGT